MKEWIRVSDVAGADPAGIAEIINSRSNENEKLRKDISQLKAKIKALLDWANHREKLDNLIQMDVVNNKLNETFGEE